MPRSISKKEIEANLSNFLKKLDLKVYYIIIKPLHFLLLILFSMKNLKAPVLSALVFFGTLFVLSVWYAAWINLDPTQADGGKLLTSTLLKSMINSINDIWTRIDGIYGTWGNIWIWITSPSAKLHVDWDIKSINTPKAWVAFNWETLAIYAGYNVSSITRGLGWSGWAYKINFSTPLPDINYAVIWSCNAWQFSGAMFTVEWNAISWSAYQWLFTTYAQVGCRISSTNVGTDSNYVTAIIYDN